MRNGMEERELLHTDGLSVGYHGKELIKEIGISLKRGEIVTLIGPNGAGKSTILKTIAKQLQEMGETAAYDQIMLAVSDFEKGNLRLTAVLSSLKG